VLGSFSLGQTVLSALEDEEHRDGKRDSAADSNCDLLGQDPFHSRLPSLLVVLCQQSALDALPTGQYPYMTIRNNM
jgi:hypothetical protein